jgi:hypothetical protein
MATAQVQARAEALVRATLALAEAAYRVGHLRELLLLSQPSVIAPPLEVACARAEQAEPRAREWLVSFVDAITTTEAEIRVAVQRLREEAAGDGHLALERVLRTPVSHEEPADVVPDPDKVKAPDYGKGRPLTLGERKSLARRPDRDMMAKLLLDPHPEVIRRLLANPRLTEDDVVRLASKRPCRPDVLTEIAQSKWAHRARVRLSIVLNPSTPAEISGPVASLLVRQELKLVAETTSVPRTLRALCLEHLERRPPGQFDDEDCGLQ